MMTNSLKLSAPTLRGSGLRVCAHCPQQELAHAEGATPQPGPHDPREVLRAGVRGPCRCITTTPGFPYGLCRWARGLVDSPQGQYNHQAQCCCARNGSKYFTRALILSPTAPNVGTVVNPL